MMNARAQDNLKQIAAAAKGREQIAEGFDLFLRGLEAKQKEFEAIKKKIDHDIQRGARLTDHKLPL